MLKANLKNWQVFAGLLTALTVPGCGGLSSLWSNTVSGVQTADNVISLASQPQQAAQWAVNSSGAYVPGYAVAPTLVGGLPLAARLPNGEIDPDYFKRPRVINLNIHASPYLNPDSAGRPLALVAKIYKLKQPASFQQATYDTFLDSQKEQAVLGGDLVEVKEITLVPGQKHHADEKVDRAADYIGIVGLFRAPAQGYWRVTFPVQPAEKTGITIGALACTLVAGVGPVMARENEDVSITQDCKS